VQQIVEIIKKKDKEERRKKIEESRYVSYKKAVTEGTPAYLRGKKNKKERSRIARFRCGNEMKGNQHWLEEEERRCRMCGVETEDIAHVLKVCEKTRDEISEEELLREDGRGSEVMRRINEIRREKREETKEGKETKTQKRGATKERGAWKEKGETKHGTERH